jgi:hypothetical protein
MRILFCVVALVLSGCSTERQILELRRDRLLAIEANGVAVRNALPSGSYDPGRYDMYLALDADVFQRVFSEIDGTKVDLDAKGRPISIVINKFSTQFKPGSPEISLDAKAIDKNTGLEVGLAIDTRLVLESNPENPGELTAKIYATRLVPDVRWGPLNFTRSKIVRSLLTLEASKLTDKLPEMKLPLAKDFSFGSSARTMDSGRINLPGDAWMRGNITLPDTRSSGRFVVNNILFLENGVHIFASVEGI